MMYLGQTPWHRLGTKLEQAPTSAEALAEAGLGWNVNLQPIQTADGVLIETHRAVRRDSDGSVLGVVGTDYRPLQNSEAFAWFDPFVQAGEATYETAGSLRDGKRVWILARLKGSDAVIVPQSDDRVVKYVLLSNSHDGSLRARVGFTATRVVCANTLHVAHTSNASALIQIKHTASILRNARAGARDHEHGQRHVRVDGRPVPRPGRAPDQRA
jgi:phage/plasmid-like protein (TIGR03299 family)